MSATTSLPPINIVVGRISARGDRAQIEAAAAALADGVVAKLPDGYDQVIGKRFRNGVDLSGGEWQKMAIARAYMCEAKKLILDEPTAAPHARAKYDVFQRFRELSAGRSAVLISHRFSNVRVADRFLVRCSQLEGSMRSCSSSKLRPIDDAANPTTQSLTFEVRSQLPQTGRSLWMAPALQV